MDLRTFRKMMNKRAASVMTPEAQQAAMQPPMDPAMAGGDPSMMGGQPPMDPSMMGGMPPQGPQGGELPPEIIQDQMFLQFLMEMAGIMFDPQSGQFMDQQGQPVPADMIMQAYQQYQQMQQGGGGQPPMDPSMMGGDPSMVGGDPSMMGGDPSMGGQPPMDPGMGGDPSMMGGDPSMGGQPPMDPSMMGDQPMPPEDPGMQEQGMEGMEPPAVPDQVMDQIVSAVMSGVETMFQQYAEGMEAKFAEMSDKLDALLDTAGKTDDTRSDDDRDKIAELRKEMESELGPVKQASVMPSRKAGRPVNIFDIISGTK